VTAGLPDWGTRPSLLPRPACTAAYDQSIKGALAAFGTEGAPEKAVTLPWGEFSGAALMWLAINDQFVHGWDLARAIGHDADLDPGLGRCDVRWPCPPT
jgi:hypothetical protein